jgi:hypothetical protein
MGGGDGAPAELGVRGEGGGGEGGEGICSAGGRALADKGGLGESCVVGRFILGEVCEGATSPGLCVAFGSEGLVVGGAPWDP